MRISEEELTTVRDLALRVRSRHCEQGGDAMAHHLALMVQGIIHALADAEEQNRVVGHNFDRLEAELGETRMHLAADRQRANDASRLSAEARDEADDLRTTIADLHEKLDIVEEGRLEVIAELVQAEALLADTVIKATEYGEQDGEQDGGFVAMYIMPTGPIHRAIPWLDNRGINVRPGFDGRKAPLVTAKTVRRPSLDVVALDEEEPDTAEPVGELVTQKWPCGCFWDVNPDRIAICAKHLSTGKPGGGFTHG